MPRLLPLAVFISIIFTTASVARSAESKPAQEARSEKGYVQTGDGVRLFYQKIGKGRQTLIVPAALFLACDFRQLADGRTLIFYDMRNRGRSDSVKDAARITIHDDVRDLEAVRAHFGVKRFSTIGYSYLGMMVMLYAKEHPERVERVVQLGPVPLKFQTEYPAKYVNRDDEQIIDGAKYRELKKLEAEGYNRSHPKEFCQKEWEVMRVRLVGDPGHIARLGSGVCDFPNEWPINFRRHLEYHFGSVQKLNVPWSEMARVRVPVLTIHGTKDRNAPYGAGREWASKLPNARLLTIEGAAHNSWADAPEIIFPAIRQFLDGKWPAAAEKITEPQ
jgi:pimeloyl-ACP methyl ester carboxylesterase